MPDPVTAGALVAAALAAGAAEMGKAALGEATRDAYARLKSLAARLFGPAADQLEARPDSGDRAAVVAELVEEQPEPMRAELRTLADAVRSALEAEGRATRLADTLNQFNAYDHATQYNAPGGTQNFGVPGAKARDGG